MNSSAAFPSNNRRGGAFTLVEVLVAVTILVLITGLLSQMMGAVSRTTQLCQQRSNNFTKARGLLDLMVQDISAGLFRSDLAFYPAAGTTTNLAFYTQRLGMVPAGTASASPRSLALVQYDIDAGSSDSPLERRDLAIDYATSPASAVSFGDAAVLSKISEVLPHDTAPGIVGLQVRFLMADGTIQSVYANTAANPLQAVAITLAVVDDQNLKLMNAMSSNKVSDLRGQLSTLAVAAPASLVKATWETSLDSTFDWSSYPRSLRTGIHVFERLVNVSPTF